MSCSHRVLNQNIDITSNPCKNLKKRTRRKVSFSFATNSFKSKDNKDSPTSDQSRNPSVDTSKINQFNPPTIKVDHFSSGTNDPNVDDNGNPIYTNGNNNEKPRIHFNLNQNVYREEPCSSTKDKPSNYKDIARSKFRKAASFSVDKQSSTDDEPNFLKNSEGPAIWCITEQLIACSPKLNDDKKRLGRPAPSIWTPAPVKPSIINRPVSLSKLVSFNFYTAVFTFILSIIF